MSLVILFLFLCAQHVSDINISILCHLLFCFSSYVLNMFRTLIYPSHQIHNSRHRKFTLTLNHPSLENKTTDVVIQQHSRKLLVMDILMSETFRAHKKWNKIASDIKLVFYSSTITMMHGPINFRFCRSVESQSLVSLVRIDAVTGVLY